MLSDGDETGSWVDVVVMRRSVRDEKGLVGLVGWAGALFSCSREEHVFYSNSVFRLVAW